MLRGQQSAASRDQSPSNGLTGRIVAGPGGGLVNATPGEMITTAPASVCPINFDPIELVPNVTCEGQTGAMFHARVYTRDMQGARINWTVSFYLANGTPVPGVDSQGRSGARMTWNTTFYLADGATTSADDGTKAPKRSRQFVVPSHSELKLNLFFPFARFALPPGYHECVALLKVHYQGAQMASCRVPFNYLVSVPTQPSPAADAPSKGANAPRPSHAPVSRNARLAPVKVDVAGESLTVTFNLGAEGFRGEELLMVADVIEQADDQRVEAFNSTIRRVRCPYDTCWWPNLTRSVRIPAALARPSSYRVLVQILDARHRVVAQRVSSGFTIKQRRPRPSEGRRRPAAGKASTPATESSRTEDPYLILGLARDCTRGELRAAYLKRARDWHPDKIAHMPQALREIATEGMKLINWAKDAIESNFS